MLSDLASSVDESIGGFGGRGQRCGDAEDGAIEGENLLTLDELF
jgi:hypothetical protein